MPRLRFGIGIFGGGQKIRLGQLTDEEVANFGSPIVRFAGGAAGQICLQLRAGGVRFAQPGANQPDSETGILIGGIQLKRLAKIRQGIRNILRVITQAATIMICPDEFWI